MTQPAIPKIETVRETFTRWLADGQTWVGVFENHDLGNVTLGRRVAFPYDSAQFEVAVIGDLRAPDTKAHGLGWRYVLVAKCRTVDEAVAAYGGDADARATKRPRRPRG